MSLFKPAKNSMAYLKIGFMGEAGSGKTHTATLVMIGLVNLLKQRGVAGADKPVFMLDTEQGSAWIAPMFKEAGIPFHVLKTRAFKDLVPAVREAEQNAAGLFIDSITHFWEDLQNSYLAKKKIKSDRLEFQDWNYLKKTWREFSDAFVNSSLHCTLCGRLGFEYETTENERTGKKQIEKSGVKMRAERELGYEPNILVWMEKDLDLGDKVMGRTATILKDRSRRIDGKRFPNPDFETFMPHIEFLALGGKHEGVDTKRDSQDMIPDDEAPQFDNRTIMRTIVLEEIEALLVERYPSRSDADRKAKNDLIKKHFKTVSWTEIAKRMPLETLQSNYDLMHRDLTGKSSRYDQPQVPEVIDEIPHMDAPAPALATPTPATVEAEPDDRDIVVHDIKAALFAADTPEDVDTIEEKARAAVAEFGEPYQGQVKAAVAEARRRFQTVVSTTKKRVRVAATVQAVK